MDHGFMIVCMWLLVQVCGVALKSSMASNAIVSESLACSKGRCISMTATLAPRGCLEENLKK